MRNNLRVLLAQKRMKVSDLAKETGISKSTLTTLYYERPINPTLETLQKLATFFEVTLDELLGVEKEQEG